MAYHWIGRSGDHKYPPPPWPTSEAEDEDEDEETSSLVNKQPQATPTTNYEEITEIEGPTNLPIPTYLYSSKMSDDQQGGPGWPYVSRPERPSGPPKWKTNNDDDYRSRATTTTLATSKYSYGYDQHQQSSHLRTTSTLVPTGSSSPVPSKDGFPDLQNNEADNGSDRTLMYAAAGVTPVVVIFIGFLIFCCFRKRRRQRRAAAEHDHFEEMKTQQKPVTMPYIARITPPSPPPAVLPQYSPSTPSSNHPPTASSSQPVILGPIPSGNNGAYLTGMDTSDIVSMRSASNIGRMGTVVDRDPFADGRSLEEAPPPYRPSSLPPASLASTSRNSSIRAAAPPERSPFDDPEDDEVSDMSGPTSGRHIDAMSNVSDLSYQIDPVIGRSPF